MTTETIAIVYGFAGGLAAATAFVYAGTWLIRRQWQKIRNEDK